MSTIEIKAQAQIEFEKSIPLFEALADEYRQRIILLLGDASHEGVNVTTITAGLSLSRPAVSHHLKLLKQVGLVDFKKKGKENFYFLTLTDSLAQLKSLTAMIEQTCYISSTSANVEETRDWNRNA